MTQDQYLLHRDGLNRFLLQDPNTGIIAGLLFRAMPNESARAFSYDYGSVWYPQQIINLKDFPELADMPFFTIENFGSMELERYFRSPQSQAIWPLLGTLAKSTGYGFSANQPTPATLEPLWHYKFQNPNGSWRLPIFGLWVNEQACWVSNWSGWVIAINHQGDLIQQHKLPELSRCLVEGEDSPYASCQDGQIYDLTSKLPQPIYDVKPVDQYYYQYLILALIKTESSYLIADAHGQLLSLNLDWQLQWQQTQPEAWQSYLLCADEHCIYRGYYQGFMAYDKQTGQLLWKKETHAPVLCGAVVDNQLIFGCSDRQIYRWLINKDPKKLPIQNSAIFTCSGIPYSLIINPNQKGILISDYENKIYFLQMDGNLQNIIHLGFKYGAATIMQIWDNYLYMGTTEGVTLCFSLLEVIPSITNILTPKESISAQTEYSTGIIVKCIKQGKKLKVRPCSSPYYQDWNVAFPKHLRVEGACYQVQELKEAKQGKFYRVVGSIKQLS